MTKDEELIERGRAEARKLAKAQAWLGNHDDGETDPLQEAQASLIETEGVITALTDRLEALAQPVVGVDPIQAGRAYLKSLDYKLEADGVSAVDIDAGSADHSWRMQAFVAGFSAALAASPSPIVGEREAIAGGDSAAKIVADRSLLTDDEMLRRIEVLARLSTPVVGGNHVE